MTLLSGLWLDEVPLPLSLRLPPPVTMKLETEMRMAIPEKGYLERRGSDCACDDQLGSDGGENKSPGVSTS